ncbi:hypothetical protein SRABI76_03562 [Microbacterium oxydans]|nr:hypothetical protein SRABI76_03562 [Microbacterium oxydans]
MRACTTEPKPLFVAPKFLAMLTDLLEHPLDIIA